MLASSALVALLAIAAAPPAGHDTTLTGTVVDEAGKPVANAAVSSIYWRDVRKTATDASGRFELRVPTSWLSGSTKLVASADDGKQQAYAHGWSAEEWKKQSPLRLKLKEARRIEGRVADEAGKPISGATFEVLADYSALLIATTDANGHASGMVPADAPLQTVFALKGGKGLDYRSYESERGGKKVSPPIGPVALTLGGTAPVRLTITDPEGKPLTGVEVYPWYLQKPGEPADINLSMLGDTVTRKTDAKGVVVFDWLPAWEKRSLTFWPRIEAHVPARISYDPKVHKGAITKQLDRLVRIRGRVMLPDGSPAVGIRVEAIGDGYQDDHFHGEVRTDVEGRWEMNAYPNMLYMVGVRDDKWGAAALEGFAVFPDQPLGSLDFKVAPATRIHGRVTIGPDKKPVVGQWMMLQQRGTWLGDVEDVKLPNPENSRKAVMPGLSRHGTTDADGRYEFHVGPGKYYLRGPSQSKTHEVEVKDQKALAFDFQAARPETGQLVGTVVTGTPPKPVAGAKVAGIYRHDRASLSDLEATTDKNGRFDVERGLYKTVLHARSADRTLAGVVEIGPDAKTATIQVQPVGSALGRLVDPDGKPLVGREVVYGVPVHIGDDNAPYRTSFGGTTKTDKDGHFTLRNLVVGQPYYIYVTTEKDTRRGVGKVSVKDAKPADLGDLALAPPQKPLTLDDRVKGAFASKQPAHQRFRDAVKDARLSKQHVLLVLADPANAGTKEFFKLRYENEEVRRALDPFRIVAISAADATALVRNLNVTLDKAGAPLLLVYDTEETRLASSEAKPREELLRFLKARAPAILDAKKVLADALATAKKEKKRVLVQETATWCGPCWALSRFLDRHRNLWAKDYVWVKIDHRWTHADAVMDGLKKGYRGGIPWTAILDADGKVLATSNDKEGQNVGFPSEQPGIDHFVAMFRKTAIRLKDDDFTKLREALEKK